MHFYDQKTGLLARQTLSTSSPNAAEIVAANTPPGFRPITGIADRESQRVDLAVAQRIDELQQTLAGLTDPDAIAALNDTLDELRPQLIVTDSALAEENRARRTQRQQRTAAAQEVEALERQQIRSISALLDDPSDTMAREHYERRKARIEDLRPIITAATDTTSPAG